ncbi:hypothetical protein N7532_011142 [Penicillium argentinense]|uniref:Large ribosomal subunit protein mL50 n=1 Tax=Penicillium argentinense TaxID=1131581 RepID=A0A9W9EHV6_9EURO|nr:uncharacterized protein N7532_011142 [Penicillium argentinense]KAJ5082099.1 hypothetical protein N7532_011142 [Penicillium argentinense]
MRPVMRLPLREALYVCSNCRQGAAPRVSPLARQFQLQTRRYASDNSPTFLERTRRKLWDGEKPPTGLSEGTSETKGELALGDGYVQAETWEGLTSVGYLPKDEWKQTGSARNDVYHRFGRETRIRPTLTAAHQTAVEICLLQLLGKDLTSICHVDHHNEQIRVMLEKCTVQATETGQWEIKFPDAQTKEALVFVFNQIGGGEPNNQIESTGDFVERDPKAESYRALSIADSDIKFAYIKRLSQLIGRRIPDKFISASNTVDELIQALSSKLKEKPVDVNRRLSKQWAAGNLPPNLGFHSSRLSRGDRDEDFGRKKAIHAEYFERGLVFPREGKKKAISQNAE